MLFQLAIGPVSQDQFAFTGEWQQWRFTVLPQSYLHSPTICHSLVARDLQLWQKPVSVHLFHCTDDIMLTCESLADLEQDEMLIPHLE